MTLAIYDWGIGGIGLYKMIRNNSSLNIIYFSDSGYTAYGKVNEMDLKERVNKVIEFLNNTGANKFAVACHSASTVIDSYDNLTGMKEHTLKLVKNINPESLIIAGGERTINSGQYKSEFEYIGIKVEQISGQYWSGCIENGVTDSAELKNDIRKKLSHLAGHKHMLLACTHYPVIKPIFNELLLNINIIDPCETVAEYILNNWNQNGDYKTKWLTTGDTTKMQYAAKKAFGINIEKIDNIYL